MAVTISVADLATAIGVDSTVATRLLPVATALVERSAPDAPGAVQDEAVIRCAGWLAEQPAASRLSGQTGDISASYTVGSLSALRHSGAGALLSPWKVRRAGAI